MAGAPSKHTPEIATKICDMLSSGKSLVSICNNPDMPSRSTVFGWLAKADEGDEAFKPFLDSYLRAREAQADAIFDECLDIADDNSRDIVTDDEGNLRINNDVIARAKLRVDTRMRMAGKLKPKKYGDRTVLAGDEDNPISHAVTVNVNIAGKK
jgi:hypothetical protein